MAQAAGRLKRACGLLSQRLKLTESDSILPNADLPAALEEAALSSGSLEDCSSHKSGTGQLKAMQPSVVIEELTDSEEPSHTEARQSSNVIEEILDAEEPANAERRYPSDGVQQSLDAEEHGAGFATPPSSVHSGDEYESICSSGASDTTTERRFPDGEAPQAVAATTTPAADSEEVALLYSNCLCYLT